MEFKFNWEKDDIVLVRFLHELLKSGVKINGDRKLKKLINGVDKSTNTTINI